jgi:hypothetical protein
VLTLSNKAHQQMHHGVLHNNHLTIVYLMRVNVNTWLIPGRCCCCCCCCTSAACLQSDYTKNVAKLAAALQRKQAFYQLLLAAIARHLLLRHLQSRQLQHMEELQGYLGVCQGQLGGFAAASSAREEAVRRLTKEALAPRYSVPPGEAHLQHMAGVVLQGSRAPSPAQGEAAAAAAAAGGGAVQLTPRGGSSLTPRGTATAAGGGRLTPRGAGAASPLLPR